MAPLPQFIDVPRPSKRRRVEMPSVADGFDAPPRPRPALPAWPAPKPPAPTPKTPLKQVLPPSFSLPNTKPLHPPRPPPPPPPLKSEPDRDLKTISTTSIGLLNSLSSSNGGEDLAAFLLPHRDQSTTVTPTSRGIDLSPEKKGKGKFIRGGLAARASTFFNRAHTSLVLWQKETERRRATRTASTLPHLTATIVTILLHLPPNSNNTKPSTAIALCRITDSSSYAPNQLYKIIFSISHLPLDRFKEGLTIRIFHPCHQLSGDVHPTPSSRRASLPLPLSLPSTPDLPINSTTTLFCSRLIF